MLARDVSLINIGDVVRHTEVNFNLVECFDRETNNCAIFKVCALKSALYTAQKRFLEELDRYTLADVVGNRRQLAKLLGVAVVVES